MRCWTWKDATPKERGEWVRQSFKDVLYNVQKLCELFNLTSDGARKILDGADWQSSFAQDYDPQFEAIDELVENRCRERVDQ